MEKVMTVLVVMALMVGCGKQESAVPKAGIADVPTCDRSYAQLSSSDVLVVANGKALTKGDLERQIAVQTELMRISRPNVKVSDVERMQMRQRQCAVRNFIQQRMMADEAARRGLSLTEEDRREIRERFTKSVLRRKSNYGALAGRMNAELRAELDEGLNADKLCQMVSAAMKAECHVAVTLAEAEKRLREIEAYNARAKAEEAAVWQNASNAWERINGGESFETTAERCVAKSEHVNSDMDWGEFEIDYFKGDAKLCHYLETMSVGAVTPPVPGDNGVLIVKMLEKLPVDFSSERLKSRYRLAKIFFELPEIYPAISAEELRKELEAERTADALKARLATLEAAVKVEYPNGKVAMLPRRDDKDALAPVDTKK